SGVSSPIQGLAERYFSASYGENRPTTRGVALVSGMRRREFLLLGRSPAATWWPLSAGAQQLAKLPRVGGWVLGAPPHPFANAFRQGLHTLGYSEGQNIAVEFRYTDGRSDRAEELASDLVRRGVDVIVAHFVPAVIAAMGATRTIPIVMAPH